MIGTISQTSGDEVPDISPPPDPSSPTEYLSGLALLRAYVGMTKPRILLLLLVTTFAAVLIAAREVNMGGWTLLRVSVVTLLGGAFAAGGAHVINAFIDRDIDLLMNRTRQRPIPSGKIAPTHALIFGIGLSTLAVIMLATLINPLSAALAASGNLFYVFIYTLWLKRTTPQNIVIGGVAGAVPPLVGWAAVTNQVSLPAILLFVIITCWTPAHFWALALMNKKDYARAAVPMLPVVSGERTTIINIIVYTFVTVASTLILYATQAMGILYLIAALALGGGFATRALQLWYTRTPKKARSLFMYSNMYLALLFAAMVIDRAISFHKV